MGKANEARRQERFAAFGWRGKVPERLTERVIEAVRTHPTGGRFKLSDGEVNGLVLQVEPDGAASFHLYYRTREGVQRALRISAAGAMSLAEVRLAAKARLAEVANGKDPLQEKRKAREAAIRAKTSTVVAYLEEVYGPEYLAHRKDGGAPEDVAAYLAHRRAGGTQKSAPSKPSGTWARILSAWKPLLDEQLAGVTRAAIEKVLADRKKAGTSIGTLQRDWAAFRAMLADAVDRGQLAALPIARRPTPIRGETVDSRVRWIGQHDPDELVRFRKALDAFTSSEASGGDFLRTAARLALATGLRRGELVRLTDSMISLREGTIALPSAITKAGKARIVHVNDVARAAIQGWTLRGTKGELFPGESERWEDRITQRDWPALLEAAKIEDLHFHDLRHHHAVTLLKGGATLAQVRDALGHASITQTEKYAHVLPSDVRKAVLAMVEV